MSKKANKPKRAEVRLTTEEQIIKFEVIKEDFSCRQDADVLWTSIDKSYKRLKKARRNEIRKELGYEPEPN